MADYKLFVEVLSDFARRLVQPFAIGDVLDDLARRVPVVLDITGAGVSLERDGRVLFVTAVDERTTRLETIQEQEQSGPCIDAWRSGEEVAVADLDEITSRWAPYGQAVRDAGVTAVAGIPMRVATKAIGALDLYCDKQRAWSDDDLAAAQVFADVATSYVTNAAEVGRQRRLTEQLQEALDSRVVIEQAKGILAAERRISVDEAFRVLRRHARNHGSSLRAVAVAVVDLGLRP